MIKASDKAIGDALSHGPKTIREMVSITGVPERRVRYTLMRWHRMRLISISEWVRIKCPDGKYRIAPKFTAVVGYDAPPPDGVNRKGLELRLEPPGFSDISIAIRGWFNA